MDLNHLYKPDRNLHGELALDGSKSISNRALIALALSGADPAGYLSNLSTSKDTVTLQRLLAQKGGTYDAGDAGTTFRFLTAFLSLQPGIQILTGSARMRERPVGALAYALRELGADIQFLEKEGYPPLQIGTFKPSGQAQIRIAANVSSQFLSALALIGPYLPDGLEIVPEGSLVSRPYLEMTVQLMRYFGAQAEWKGNVLVVAPGKYQPRAFTVEADWSAASYWYAMAAFAGDADLKLRGLFAQSWQGDAVLARMMTAFSIQTTFEKDGIRLRKSGAARVTVFNWDFVECPDIAQTLAVVCGGLGVEGFFTGLETLSIKETDRIAALQVELKKTGVVFEQLLPEHTPGQTDKIYYRVGGKAAWTTPVRFATYGDHRMAMAFAPLAFYGALEIEHPAVVGKSYPAFWADLSQLGFDVKKG